MTSQATSHVKTRIAANVRRAQAAKGMTGREIADAVGATPDQFSKWRRGEICPSFPYLTRLADVLTNGDIAYFYSEHKERVA